MLHDNTINFSWEAEEFKFKEKRKDWYWIIGAAAVIGIVVSIIFSNYLFAVLIFIAGVLMIQMASREPGIYIVEVSNEGVQVGEDFYVYENIMRFWITKDTHDEPTLLLLTNQRINPILVLPIHPNIEILELRDMLLDFVEEEKMKVPLSSRIIHKIGF